MDRFLKMVAACVMASLCLSVSAQEKPTAKAKAAKGIDYSKALTVGPITPEMRQNFLRFMQEDFQRFAQAKRTLLIPLKDSDCPLQSGGVCAIKVPVLFLPSVMDPKYCVAVFPEVVTLPGAKSSSPEKTIVWTLDPESTLGGTTTFAFYSEKDHGIGQRDLGIILLQNDSSQMHSGIRGNGTGSPTKLDFLFKNKHKVPAKAVYLPIVVRTDNAGTSSQKISVCGTPDPLIENTP